MNKIAVVGLSSILPGSINIEEFKRNIMEKRESIVDIPDKRWIIKPQDIVSSDYKPDRACSKRAGLIIGFEFDPSDFLIPQDILLQLDFVHKIVLHAGKNALSQCWHNQELRKKTGVVLAAIALPTAAASKAAWQIVMRQKSEYIKSSITHQLSPALSFNPITNLDAVNSGMVSMPAAILASAMGLGGGSFTLDAACASSLYAIKIACEKLNSGKVDMMVAGGVSCADSLYTQIGFTQLRALSPSGRCSPFDKSADGLVVGEGAGVIVLKRLSDAIKCGDRIWGIISGAGWSNDIEGNLVAPASEGQIRAMKSAYKNAGLSPYDVQYIECHGSGTPIGDNVELNSMAYLLKDAKLNNCAVGSIKSMIGHLLTAAGVAGFIKTLLFMSEKILPPSLNFSEPSDDTPLHKNLFHVQTAPEEWKKPVSTPRRAGISAFGFGGINAHIIVEEFQKNKLQIEVPASFNSKNEKHINSFETGRKIEINNSNKEEIAIVGMEVVTPCAINLEAFRKILFKDSSLNEDTASLNGFWFDSIDSYPGEFHIPPNQIKDLLPQHIIILKAAMGAVKDADITPRPDKEIIRTDFGAAIGIEFDYGATDFHIRWKTIGEFKKAREIFQHNGLEEHEQDSNLEFTKKLTPERTLGALGGIAASRVAREFKIGGPCFTVSAGSASGIKALEIAIESLQRGETKVFICGSVDMAGDIRQDTLNRTLRNYALSYDKSLPFDKNSEGVFPSEGAAAIVLKTLTQAKKDGDRVYAVIKGLGSSSGGEIIEPFNFEDSEKENTKNNDGYAASLLNALNDAEISLSDIGLYQAHGSGDINQDSLELNTIQKLTTQSNRENFAINSASAILGDTGAVSGLISIIQSALSIYHKIIPPLPKFRSSVISSNLSPPIPNYTSHQSNYKFNPLFNNKFYFPKFPSFWIKEKIEYSQNLISEQTQSILTEKKRKNRIAVAASITTDGAFSHAVLEECYDYFSVHVDDFQTTNIAETTNIPETTNIAETTVISDIESIRKATTESIRKIGRIAFLYPGSGNHFIGMGRKLGIMFPDILLQMEESGASLNKRILPNLYYPNRLSYEDGWEEDALREINSHAHNMIFGQVSFGVFMTKVAEKFGLKPDVCIGHSLGETAGLFSLGVWNNPEDMLVRMESSHLFTKKLAGEYSAAKKVWQLRDDEIPQWRVAAVNRGKKFVKSIIEADKYDKLYLLIVNTPDECVIGGSADQVEMFIKKSSCGAMYLDGVVTVHCPIAKECDKEYLNLHRFECSPPQHIDFYSCYLGKKYIPETESTAQSILNQAIYGFDYTELIENAWIDGVRVFIEMGPGSSCTRAVGKILGDKPHLAVSLSASSKDEDEGTALFNALETIAKYRFIPSHTYYSDTTTYHSDTINIDFNSKEISLQFPIDNSGQIAADAHLKFLEFSQNNMEELEKQFSCLTKMASQLTEFQSYPITKPPLFDRDMCMEFAVGLASNVLGGSFKEIDTYPVRVRLPDEPLMLVDRIIDIEGEMLSLKSGRIITQHDVKPNAWYLDGGKAPVSISIEAGQADLFLCSWLGIDHIVKGKRRYRLLDAKVTFHRALPEPGDTIEYHIEIDRFLKQGEIYLFFFHYQGFILSKNLNLRCSLDNLNKTSDNIDNTPELLISMRDGCAGFFTLDEVKNSGGIILKKEDMEPVKAVREDKVIREDKKTHINEENREYYLAIEPFYRIKFGNSYKNDNKTTYEHYTDAQIEALRHGSLEACFGKEFKGIVLGKNLRLPGGKMHLIDRVLKLDLTGGRFGLGFISAEADIHPDDWFLTCHFVDDMVMPGTLMYECCSHALRIFTQRIGWVTTKDEPFYDVIEGIESDLKCRGPVTKETKKARYEIEVKEIGYKKINNINYEPYIIADAHMFSDNHRIVLYKNMGMKIVGLS